MRRRFLYRDVMRPITMKDITETTERGIPIRITWRFVKPKEALRIPPKVVNPREAC